MCSKYKTLKIIINRHCITSGDISDFSYHLPEPIFNVVNIKLSKSIIENFIYNVDEDNNKFKFNDVEYSFPIGIYTNLTFLETLKNLLNINIYYDNQKHLIFDTSNNLDFNVPLSLNKVCGFDKNEYSPVNNKIRAPYSYNLSKNNIIFIQSKELNEDIILPNQIRVSNEIIVPSNSYGVSFNTEFNLNNNDKDIDFKTPFILSKLSIRFCDINGLKVNLNNGEILLIFDVIVKI